jgi:hypothetical protein
MAQNTILYAALATPVNAAFSTATTGGTLAAGTYSYRVSALDGHGGETLASDATTQTTTGSTSTVTVNWGAVTGATGYKVYGRTVAGEQLLVTLGNVTTWTDDGSATPSGALPTANTTGKGEATSTDIVVAAGATVTVGIFGAAGAYLPPGVPFAVMQDTPDADNLYRKLDGTERSTVLDRPGTYRVKRPTLSGDPFGVFTET